MERSDTLKKNNPSTKHYEEKNAGRFLMTFMVRSLTEALSCS